METTRENQDKTYRKIRGKLVRAGLWDNGTSGNLGMRWDEFDPTVLRIGLGESDQDIRDQILAQVTECLTKQGYDVSFQAPRYLEHNIMINSRVQVICNWV